MLTAHRPNECNPDEVVNLASYRDKPALLGVGGRKALPYGFEIV